MKWQNRVLCVGLGLLCLYIGTHRFHGLWPYDLARWSLFLCLGWMGKAGYPQWKSFFFLALAVIFNPLAPVRFGNYWPFVDRVSGIVLLIFSLGWNKQFVSRLYPREASALAQKNKEWEWEISDEITQLKKVPGQEAEDRRKALATIRRLAISEAKNYSSKVEVYYTCCFVVCLPLVLGVVLLYQWLVSALPVVSER